MKNLPDKIYLNFGEITKEEFEADDYNEFCKLDEFAVTFCEDKVYDTDVEYVRKDAFIEKAEKAMIEWAGTYVSKTTGGGVRERKVLATDLLNYFKKYIKGE